MKKLIAGLIALALLTIPAVAQTNVNAGVYQVTPDTLVDGQKGPLLTDANRRLVVTFGTSGALTVSKDEDAAHTSGDTGTFVLGVRNDSGSSLTSTNGDYSPIAVEANGAVQVNAGSGATAFAKNEDAVHSSGDRGVPAWAVRNEGGSVLTDAQGDYSPIAVASAGQVITALGVSSANASDAVSNTGVLGRVLASNSSAVYQGMLPYYFNGTTWDRARGDTTGAMLSTGALGPAKLEDTGHTSGDAGLPLWGVRNDAVTSLGSTDLDYIPVSLDQFGRVQIVSGSGASSFAKNEDAAHTTADQGVPAYGVRNDTNSVRTSTDLDYGSFSITDYGAQVVVTAPGGASWSYAAAASGIVSSTADVAMKTAAGAGIRNYVKTCNISHATLSAATEFVIKDGSTVLWRGTLGTVANESMTLGFDPALRGTANTAVNAAAISSVTGGIYISCQGFVGP